MPPSGSFAAIAAGDISNCALGTASQLACWGQNAAGDAALGVPPGAFQVVSLDDGACALDACGRITCWPPAYVEAFAVPDASQERFLTVAVGVDNICGILQSGRIECYGNDILNVSVGHPTDAGFVGVDIGHNHACALAGDGSVACWGAGGPGDPTDGGADGKQWGQATPPSGTFTSFSTGYDFTCAIRTDGGIACWGNGELGKTTAPDGTFQEVSCGYTNACAIRNDGSLVCWGSNTGGRSDPPSDFN